VVCLLGCGSGSAPVAEAPKPAAVPEGHIDPATAGSISGRVLFKGDAPVMQVIDFSSNPQCERQHKTPFKAETVVVNPNGTLRYTFVHIKDGLAPAHWSPPATKVQIAQTGCIYEPHVQGILEGQDLEILNNDPVNHNVHAECEKNDAWNESQAPRAEHKFKQFAKEEIMIPVSCSVHPWMRAYIGVSSHPFFAVTGADGSFTIEGVPPGTYTIEAVHEKYGSKEGRLTVTPKGAATIDFTYGN
jgi:plastocyanin